MRRTRRRFPDLTAIDWERAAYAVISIIGAGVIIFTLGWLLHHVLHVLLLLAVSGCLAYALMPVVDTISARTRAPRWLGTSLVYAVLLVVAGGGGYWSIGQFVAQAAALVNELPRYGASLDALAVALQQRLGTLGVTLQLSDVVAQATASLQAVASAVLDRSVTLIRYLTGLAADSAVVLFVSGYLVVDAHRIGRGLQALAPRRYRRLLRAAQAQVSDVLGGYIRGQLVLCLLIGTSVGVVCTVLGVRFPLVLGVLGFFFELIPMVGPVLIGVIVGLVAVLQSAQLLLMVVAFYVVLQLVESNVLGPRITGHAVDLPPVVAILAILGGAELGGIVGALFAVPAAALGTRLLRAAVQAWTAQVERAPRPDRFMAAAVAGSRTRRPNGPSGSVAADVAEPGRDDAVAVHHATRADCAP